MNAPMELPRHALTIADTFIRQDANGRYCLNDLHKSAGNENRHRPSLWVENRQTQELIEEITKAGIPALASVKGGNQPGTYVVKELVYAYAMWISAAFHLKVIRAYDAMVTAPQHLIPQSLPEALRLAADLADQKAKVEAQLAIAAPKAEALDLISAGTDTLTMTEVAKVLGMKRNDLTARLHAEGWIYRQNGSWVAYDSHIRNGCLQYKEATYTDDKTGQECRKPYCHVTPKGLAKLARMFSVELEPA